MKKNLIRLLSLIIALLLLASCGRTATVLDEGFDKLIDEEETDAKKISLRDDASDYVGYESYNPYDEFPTDLREKSYAALKRELEQNMKGKGFPDYAQEMLRQMLERLYSSYDKWDGFFEDMPEKHTFIRMHLIDILPDIKKISHLKEGTPEYEEVVEKYGENTNAFSDGNEMTFLNEPEPDENGQYEVGSLATLMHEIQHIRQNDIIYSDYFDSQSSDNNLKWMFVEGGATFYSAFLDEPGTKSSSTFMPSDGVRWLSYDNSSEESGGYAYYTKHMEKIVFFAGFQAVENVFMAKPLAGLKKALAKQYGVETTQVWLNALGNVMSNYGSYSTGEEDDVIINRIIYFERLCTQMIEQKIDKLDSKQAVLDFIKKYRQYKAWFIPTLSMQNDSSDQEYIDAFIGLNRADKHLTAFIEKHAALRFSDKPAINSDAIQALLTIRHRTQTDDDLYAYSEVDSIGKLYVEHNDSDGVRNTAYYVDGLGNISVRIDSECYEYMDEALSEKEINEIKWYSLMHFVPKEKSGKIYTVWRDTQNMSVTYQETEREHITLGEYPQSQVKDDKLLQNLGELPLTWTELILKKGEYGNTARDVKLKAANVSYEGNRYRAMQISFDKDIYEYVYWNDNYTYEPNVTYWFKYEPLNWTILDNESGLVLCDKIVDYHMFQKNKIEMQDEYGQTWSFTDKSREHYSCQYEYSSIRQWLNNSFFFTAFRPKEQEKVIMRINENEPYSPFYPQVGSQPTEDRVFLPSLQEMTDSSYGFSVYLAMNEKDRARPTTDYVQFLSLGDCERYVLRTPGTPINRHCTVYESGSVYLTWDDGRFGICPAMCVDLTQF